MGLRSYEAEKGFFVDLNKIISDKYGAKGEEKVNTYFTVADHTHTNEAGARMNAASVVEGLKKIDCPLNKFLSAAVRK